MEYREFANASQPEVFSRTLFAFSKGLIPIALWNEAAVGSEETPQVETEQEEKLFGAHIEEAISVLKGMVQKRV